MVIRANAFVLDLPIMAETQIQTNLLMNRLRTFEFLRGLEEETLAELAKSASWKIYAADAVIFWEGDIEKNLFFLQYGWLKVMRSAPDGREQVLRFLGPGEIFNELGVFARRPNPATAIALEEAGIWLIPRHALEQILFMHPHTAMQIMENMADRFISLVDLTVDLSLRTVEARLAKLLLEQAQDDVIPRQRWLTLTELAARLGTVPDVLSRIIRELTRAGLIEMDKQQIRILDRERLAERAMIPDESNWR
jgi:CRP-like cAMP-binding protein